MKAIDELVHEHVVIKLVLASLGKAADRLDAGLEVRPGMFVDVADFAKEFVDACHHAKEETVLFPELRSAGGESQFETVERLLAEHQAGRELAAGLRAAAQHLSSGSPGAPKATARIARSYITLLSEHIVFEDTTVFPSASALLPSDVQVRVAAEFERIELEETGEGVHERFHELAHDLQREAASWGENG